MSALRFRESAGTRGPRGRGRRPTAICATAPFYFRPETVRDLAEFIKRIAPGLRRPPRSTSITLPAITGVNLPMSEFVKIMLDEVPNFAGDQVHQREPLRIRSRCAALGKDRIQMMFGRDEMLLGALAMGAQAGVGTTFNYLPKIYRGVIDAFEAGDMEKARSFMELSHRAVAISARYGLASIKVFMKFAGIDAGPMRSPVGRLSAEQENRFRRNSPSRGLTAISAERREREER